MGVKYDLKTMRLENKLLTFKNKTLRKICDPVFDSALNT